MRGQFYRISLEFTSLKKYFPNLTIFIVICNNLWHILQPTQNTTWHNTLKRPSHCLNQELTIPPNTFILLRKWSSQEAKWLTNLTMCLSSYLAYPVLASSLSKGRKRQLEECRGHFNIAHTSPQILPSDSSLNHFVQNDWTLKLP